MTAEAALRDFGAAIQRVIGRGDLLRAECLELFRQILRDEQPELQQGALLGALAAKGETPEEVAGVWQAVDELDTRHVELDGDGPQVENCGPGMDRLKTFNISSAAAVVAAAGVERSRELLQSGRAFATLCRWVRIQGGADGSALERFRERARRLGLAGKVPL
jgi:anthranilate phosphoribosyltransferase